jgi:NTE family protein
MRASMSIPGVFSPIRKDTMLLIDGGIRNNYPVDVARQMGANIVIGVDVGEGLYKADRIKNMMDIVNQIINIHETDKRKKNIQDTDIYIKVNAKGYSMASFTNEAIDTLIMRGEEAGRFNYDKLKKLGDSLGGNKAYLATRGKHYEKADSSHNNNEYVFESFPTDAIGLSANFNQEEMASLIIQAYKTLPFIKRPSQIGATIRLGKRYKLKLNHSTMLHKGLYIDFNYDVSYNDIKFNKEGESFANSTFSSNIVSLDLTQSWRWAKIDGGIRFNNYNFKSMFIEKGQTPNKFTDMMEGSTNYCDIYFNARVNTTNKKRFATKGMKIDTEINAYRGHEIKHNGEHSIYSLRAFCTFYASPTNRLTLIPSVYFRSLNDNSYTYGISNVIGGEWESHYTPTHIPFYGLNYIEWQKRTVTIARLQTRYRLGKSHYITGIFNIGNDGDGVEEVLKTTPMLGYGINYSYDTFIGPLGLTISTSNIKPKPTIMFSIGYIF